MTFLVITCIILIIYFSYKNNKKKKERIAEVKRKEQEEREFFNVRQRAKYYEDSRKFFSKNGTPDKTIAIQEFNFASEIHVYKAKKEVYIFGVKYNFCDILGCSIEPGQKDIKMNIECSGGLFYQDIKNIDAEAHISSYNVLININNIENPFIKITLNGKGCQYLAKEINALMTVIAARK